MKQPAAPAVILLISFCLIAYISAQSNLPDWDECTDSSQCQSNCCSGQWSNGVLKCTPSGSSSQCVHGGGGGGKPTSFTGNNTGIGSWFNANNDGTNGHSWCGYPYNNGSPVFAPDIQQMTNGTDATYPNPLWNVYGSIYCGLEAIVKDGNTGNVMTLYIGDSFAHEWVRTPGSIDIMSGVWSKLHNMPATNKDNVINPVEWYLTGNRSPQYCFQCAGN